MRVGLVAAKAMDYIIETVGVLPKSGLLTCALQDKGCRLRLMSTIRCPCKDGIGIAFLLKQDYRCLAAVKSKNSC